MPEEPDEETMELMVRCFNAHAAYCQMKDFLVIEMGGPTDPKILIEIWSGTEMSLVQVLDKDAMKTVFTVIRPMDPDMLVWSGDAWVTERRIEEFNPGEKIQPSERFAALEPDTKEILTTVALDRQGRIAQLMTPYTYGDDGMVRFGETDGNAHAVLGDMIVALRRSFASGPGD